MCIRDSYAPRDLVMPALDVWPAWAGDRTPPGELVRQGYPLATVLAVAADNWQVRDLAATCAARFLSRIVADARPLAPARFLWPVAAPWRSDDHALE